MVRLAVLAAVTMMLVGASPIARYLGLPLSVTVEPAAATDFACGPYTPLAPSGGVVRSVSNQAELTAALAAARPGDVINLADGVYTRIDYQLDRGHRPGTASAPIVIQAAAGASPIVDAGDNGNPSRRFAVSLIRTAHVRVRGLEIRNGIFGALSRGSASITFEHNHIHHLGQVGVATGAAETTSGYEPSSNTVIRCNRIHHTGMLDHEYGEGIYVGTGSTGVVDRTTGVLIEGNEIHSIANEAVDVKRYTTDVTIRHNLIHDVTPYYGGAISLGLNKNNWGPANYLVEENSIWNVSSGLYYAQAIAVAHGPTVIRNNRIWSVETRISDSWPWTATIQVHGDDNNADWAYGFGNPTANRVDIVGNTIIGCNQGCIDSYTDPGQITPTLNVESNIVDRASTGAASNGTDIIVTAADLVGPVTGTADSGSGPGSGLRLRSSPPPTTTAPPPPPPTTTRQSTTVATTSSSAPRKPKSSSPPTTTARTRSTRQPTRDSTTSVPANRPSATASTDTTRAGNGPAGPVPVVGADPTAPPGPRPASGVNTTTRPSRSISTTRAATTQQAVGSTAASWWRRGPSDLRLFLDLNLGPDIETTHKPPGTPFPQSPDGPNWLVALTTSVEPMETRERITPTSAGHHREGPIDNATTTDDQGSATPILDRGSTGEVPNTTQRERTPGLTASP